MRYRISCKITGQDDRAISTGNWICFLWIDNKIGLIYIVKYFFWRCKPINLKPGRVTPRGLKLKFLLCSSNIAPRDGKSTMSQRLLWGTASLRLRIFVCSIFGCSLFSNGNCNKDRHRFHPNSFISFRLPVSRTSSYREVPVNTNIF